MKVIQVIPSLEERHGGPSRSVRALAGGLAGAGCAVSLFTTHPTEDQVISEGNLTVRSFTRDHPQRLCPSRGLEQALKTEDADLIHHHSIWLRTLHYAKTAAARQHCPFVISPRGMMSSWSWRHRRWKKWLAQKLIHPGAFTAATGWHATSSEEADEIRALGFQQPICVSPNAISEPTIAATAAATADWQKERPLGSTQRIALFYSRFHRKKRVLELIDLWIAIAPHDWLLFIVGIPEKYSVAELEAYVLRASAVGRIRIFDSTGRPPPYAIASLFLLPSHSENFGLVIAEAMAHGLPVVVTDSTPWTELNKNSAGWCVPWEKYASTLKIALNEETATLALRGEAARLWVLANYSWEKSARILSDFYLSLKNSRL